MGKWPHLAEVTLSCVGVAEVKLPIGMDHTDPHDVFEYRKVPLLQNTPMAILTAICWAIQGYVGPAMKRETGLSCYTTPIISSC